MTNINFPPEFSIDSPDPDAYWIVYHKPFRGPFAVEYLKTDGTFGIHSYEAQVFRNLADLANALTDLRNAGLNPVITEADEKPHGQTN